MPCPLPPLAAPSPLPPLGPPPAPPWSPPPGPPSGEAAKRPRRLPARVYWVRRLLVLGVVVALVWGVTAVLGGSPDDTRETAAQSGSPEPDPTGSTPPDPATDPATDPAVTTPPATPPATSGGDVLLRVTFDAGHGLGSTRTQADEETADVYAFVLTHTAAAHRTAADP